LAAGASRSGAVGWRGAALFGLRQRSPAGVGMATAGVALALRSVTNRTLGSLLEHSLHRDMTAGDSRDSIASPLDDETADDGARAPAGGARPGRALH